MITMAVDLSHVNEFSVNTNDTLSLNNSLCPYDKYYFMGSTKEHVTL